jgi:hypothetical protein
MQMAKRGCNKPETYPKPSMVSGALTPIVTINQ